MLPRINISTKAFISIIILFISILSYSQEPTYFRIGQKEFSNTHVYSLLSAKDGRLYVTTNYGLFVYKNGTFKNITGPKSQTGDALFALRERQDGTIFCCNLSGQFFELVKGRLILHAELPVTMLTSQVDFHFDKAGALIAFSRGCMRWSKKGWVPICGPKNMGYIESLTKSHDDGRLFLIASNNDSLFVIEDDTLHAYEAIPSYRKSSRHSFFQGGNLTTYVENGTLVEHHPNGENVYYQTGLMERLRQTRSGELYALHSSKGIHQLKMEKGQRVIEPSFLQEEFISAISESTNGTIYLGTFNNGIIVIPRKNTQTYSFSYANIDFQSICSDKRGNVFLPSRSGKLFVLNNAEIKVIDQQNTPYHAVFYADKINFGINTSFPGLLYNCPILDKSKFSLGAIKTLISIDDSTVIVGTANGIYKTGPALEQLPWICDNKRKWSKLIGVNNRSSNLAYNPADSSLWFSENGKLFFQKADTKKEQVIFQKQGLLPNDLLFYKDEIWCSTQRNGIVTFKNGQPHRQLTIYDGLGNNYVKKIAIQANHLFISHKEGFQIYDLTTKEWTTLGVAEGLTTGSPNDFTLSQNKLWMLCDDAPISIDLNDIPQISPVISLNIDSISVNETRINWDHQRVFNHDQKRFSFYLEFIGIPFESETKILYRIKGLEKTWNVIPSTSHHIEYKSLPIGKFTFEVKAVYRNISTVPIEYSFEIVPPFWQRWWFYLIISLSIVAIIVVSFLIRIRRIRKINGARMERQRIQTSLLESELKALRSQMNPHFIFNSLNSIQELILKEDTDASYDYIVLFSDLVRSTLSYSNQQFIPIEKEIEFLDVYLSLEKLRFKEEFSYEINYDDEQEIDVPSMLIQPFIENALLHGLLHKEGHKKLTIDFRLNDTLTCSITDNGVGRQRAKEIQERQGNKHESFAIGAIEKRIAIINEQLGQEIGTVTIHDLEEDGKPSGTCIELTIPFMRHF